MEKATLPTRQLAILAICRFADPVASTSVYPYVPELVAGFGVPTDKIGMYSGWLSAVFSLSQAMTGVAWGVASDKMGRKPVIIIALTSTMVSSVAFGFSTSLASAFTTRAFQGASSGNVGILRTAVAELVPQKELQPSAFSIMPLVWNIGSIFGPMIGGFFSNPQRHGWFEHSDLFRKYPFALPNLMISFLFLIGIIIGILFLRESHQDKKHRRDYGLLLGSLMTSSCSRREKRKRMQNSDEADPFLGESGSAMTSPVAGKFPPSLLKKAKPVRWRDVFSRQSTINLVAYTGLAMHSMAFDQLIPVFMHHPVQSRDSNDVHLPFRFAGGFGLESGRIGVLFTVYGISGMLVQFFMFPPLARKFGVLNCFKFCAVCFPFVYLVIPFTSLLPTNGLRQGICLPLMLIKGAVGIFAFPCSTILLTNSAVSLSILGTLNGVSTSISAAGRAAGPALVGWAFTIGVDVGYVVIPFWILSIVSIISAIPVWSLIEMEGPNVKTAENDGDDHDHDLRLEEDRHSQEHTDQQLLHDEEDVSGVVSHNTSFGILAGTEEVELLDDNVPISIQNTFTRTTMKPEPRRRSSSYSLETFGPS